MAVSHLLGNIFGVGSWRVREGEEEEEGKVEEGEGRGGGRGVRRAGRSRPWKVGPPSSRSSPGRLFVEGRSQRCECLQRGRRIRVSVNVLVRGRGFCQRQPRAFPSHSSRIRRMSLEDRLLFCLPPRSRERTSFGRHRRSVQTPVPLCEVTSDKAVRRQRAQASPAALSM